MNQRLTALLALALAASPIFAQASSLTWTEHNQFSTPQQWQSIISSSGGTKLAAAAFSNTTRALCRQPQGLKKAPRH
jgi:hypothetical protein